MLREQLVKAIDQIKSQGDSTSDPFLDAAKIEHEQFGDRIISESERQVCYCCSFPYKRNLMLEEAEEVGNGPKDIALFCASVGIKICFFSVVSSSTYFWSGSRPCTKEYLPVVSMPLVDV